MKILIALSLFFTGCSYTKIKEPFVEQCQQICSGFGIDYISQHGFSHSCNCKSGSSCLNKAEE